MELQRTKKIYISSGFFVVRTCARVCRDSKLPGLSFNAVERAVQMELQSRRNEETAQTGRERVFGKRLILRCKDMLSWVLVTLFNCRVGSFCDILLAFSASPHHIKLTYPRINCLNTHFLSDNCRQNYFDFPKKQDCGALRDEQSESQPAGEPTGKVQAALGSSPGCFIV